MNKKAFVEDRAIEIRQDQHEMKNDFEVTDYLLFLIQLDDLEILGLNLKSHHFLKPEPEILSGDHNEFFKYIVHPEDYNRFIAHLESCRDLKAGMEMSDNFRIKTPKGSWQEFSFNHRLYSGEIPNCILSFGKEVSDAPSLLDNFQGSYKALMDSLDDAYCRIDMIFDKNRQPLDYLFLETNCAFGNHISLGPVEGKTMKELEPGLEEYWFQIYGNVALTHSPKRFQELARKISETWLNVYAFPIGSENFPQVAVLFSNITENKLAMKKLEEMNELLEKMVVERTRKLIENSELLQTVFDNSNQGIAVFEPIYKNEELVDFRYLRVNTIVKKIFRNSELIGKKYSDYSRTDQDLEIFEALKATMLSGRFHDFEIKYSRKERTNWFRITARRKNGLLITSVEDITRRKLESQRLKESIRFKKHLTGASPDIIMIFNLYDENIRYINRDMAPVKGMRKKDILGKHLLDILPFIHPKEREEALDFHTRIIKAQDRDVLEWEFRLRSGKGKYTWYNALGKVFMRNKKANVYEYMILLRDIDDQKATQKALIAAEKLSIKGEIARTFAHELRNPIASIGMASDILQKKISEDEQVKNLLNIIKRSAKTLNELLTDLLTSSNYTPSVLEKNCLAKILEDSLQMAKDRIYLSGIRVVKNYQGNYYISADEEKLKIAFLNIIVNASEAMVPEEGVLQFSITRADDNYTLSITDNGCGLEKEQLEKLFDAFYSQKPNGMGVGLSSVKSILEEHDARIEVLSEPNKGTTFHLSFHCHDNFQRS